MKRIRGCAIIINQEKIVLMGRKRTDVPEYFVFPGGGHEAGETLEETATREAMEETSLVVKTEKLLYHFTDERSEHNFYLCSYISGEPKLGIGSRESMGASESNQYEPVWKSIADVAHLPLVPQKVKDWFLSDVQNNFANCPRIT